MSVRRSVCVSVSACVTFVVFTDCESCTRPISTHPRSMEAGEYGLTRGACFVAPRLEVVAVAGLLWISRCVSSGAVFSSCFFFVCFFAFEWTRPDASTRPLASFTSLQVLGSSLDSKMARTSTLAHADSRRAVIGEMHFLYRPRWHTGDVKQGRLILFLAPPVQLSNLDPPARGGGI